MELGSFSDVVVAAFRTTRISAITNDNGDFKIELDSHADTSVVGDNALITHDHCRKVNVYPYNKADGHKVARIVNAAYAYDDRETGSVSILEINQAIEIKGLDQVLLCPMQVRMNGITVNEVPKFLLPNPTPTSHAVVLNPDSAHPYVIPLSLDGVTSYFSVRKPTAEEYEDDELPHYDLTANDPLWDPSSDSFAKQEDGMLDYRGHLLSRATPARGQLVINSVESLAYDAVDVTDDDNFATILDANVNVSIAQVESMRLPEAERNIGRVSSSQKASIDYMDLAERWCISPEKAKQTVQRTTQRGIRTTLHPSLSRRFRTNDRQLRYRRLPHPVFSDTMFANTTSRRGNKCAQVFATDFGWSRVYPMKSKGLAHEGLSCLLQNDGVPPAIICDGAKEMVEGEFRRKLKEASCQLKQLEPYSPWTNAAEREIKELKKGASRKMIARQVPKRLWDDCLEFESHIRSNTVNSVYKLNGEVPETVMSGQTSDISQFCEFGFYDWTMWFDEKAKFPDGAWTLGRYLGPSIDVGPAMTSKILTKKGTVLHRSTYRPLSEKEVVTMTDDFKLFNESIQAKLGPSASPADFPAIGGEETVQFEPYYAHHEVDVDDIPFSMKDEPEPTPEAHDQYVNAEVMLPRGDKLARGKVIGRKRDANGDVAGRANANPILDTRTYEVEFADGEINELTANIIATSMYSQCDEGGNEYMLLDSFVDIRKTADALSLKEQEITVGGRKSKRHSTAGWDICCQWFDGSTTWERLKDLKESHPIQTAEYAVCQGVDHEPAFNYWVPHVLKYRERIISLVRQRNARYLKKTHKFGIEVPKSVEDALAIDKRNGNTLWQDAIAKEMKNVRVAFNILPDGSRAPVGHQKIRCHMIFDVKMEDFRRKARLVAGGHTTEAPATMTYASVVSRETVRIALTIAALNDLEVKAADVLNAYVTAPNKEKIYTILGPEFGKDAGKMAVVVRALYGLKSAGAAFRAHLGDCMKGLGYRPCLADPDLWMKPMVRPCDGVEYYSYILCYVDDILVIHHDSHSVLRLIDKYFPLKPGSVGDPDMYLGTKLRRMRLDNGVIAWGMSPAKYVKESVRVCEEHIKTNLGSQFKLVKRAINPFPMGCDPEMDTTPELDPEKASYYQSIIGVLRWMVEIGRIDIITEVSLLASHLALPREGHLEAALHIMAYLRDHNNSRMAFDPSYPDINMGSFKDHDWGDFYEGAEEAIPTNAPRPLGKDVDLRMMVDSDHAGDKRSRRSRTGYLIYMNMALVQWHSKKQSTVETSVFGAEFVAMKTGIDTLRGIRYKLRMMGVPISGPTFIYGDNMSVIHNTSKPESQLSKKCNSICYHAVRESVAMGESLTAHIPTDKNSADLLTKVLYGQKRRYHVSNLLYDIFD